MRLQLTQTILLFLLFTQALFSQESDAGQREDPSLNENSSYVDKKSTPVDVDFLFHYYEQDGDHSAVTGGMGTEELKDIATKFIVNIPLDSTSQLSVSAGMNYYSSASTDNIDQNVSSASADDYRGQFSIDYTRRNSARRYYYGFAAGGSSESDYISVSIGGKWGKESRNGNRGVDLFGRVFFDKWMIILPDELRRLNQDHIETDNRRSYYLSLTYFQILTKRLQTSITSEFVYQRGLLSTPFHRAFFEGSIIPKVEKLPNKRFKFPIGVRFHYFWGDKIVLRLFYRYYYDSFGIYANTISLETPLKIGNFFTLYPFYRFHSQKHSKYFREFGLHQLGQDYYSSDFDLSSFDSHKVGLGLRYTPLYSITSLRMPFSRKALNLKSFDVRYANYQREDGLKTFLISTHLAFTLF
jgi:hypothetical protein